eukprot:CAMPEP_0172725642 /NCGR_PEP_ID=MMETSP1074-20121228/88877_1 /TAXON_ID=2916 /ORGANISM="Ceratium fusus, Strain PA161109" /LENGTH=163 /DNA_ID=CAMNT_0013552469 /DNA_START=127 /DNA_END=619 /DNA_ORIENTATION=-
MSLATNFTAFVSPPSAAFQAAQHPCRPAPCPRGADPGCTWCVPCQGSCIRCPAALGSLLAKFVRPCSGAACPPRPQLSLSALAQNSLAPLAAHCGSAAPLAAHLCFWTCFAIAAVASGTEMTAAAVKETVSEMKSVAALARSDDCAPASVAVVASANQNDPAA